MSVPPRGAALARIPREQLSPALYVKRFPAGRRLDQLVLLDLAESADFRPETWGEHAFPSVPAIAERIGYCERSVQYALRRLEADARLERLERDGRTSVYRIVRHLELVDHAGDVAPATEQTPAAVAPGGAMVAPDQGLPTVEVTPPPPAVVPESKSEPPVGGAHAAPEAPRAVSPDHPPSPGAPLALVEGPHRRMRSAGLPADPAEPSADDPAPGLSGSGSKSRERARAKRCPKCHALPGRPCTRSGGTPRRSNHAERRELFAAADAEAAAAFRRRRPPPCPHHGEVVSWTPDGECGACRADRLEAGGGTST